MRILSVKQKGRSHLIDQQECQDALFIQDRVAVLADGVSHSPYAALGAKTLVQQIGQRLSEPSVIKDLDRHDDHWIKVRFLEWIETITQELISGGPSNHPDDYASTLLAAWLDQGHITLIHCGDGAIFGLPNTGEMTCPVILSYPDQNAYGEVYPASSKKTIERMRVLRVHCQEWKALLLGMDGFTDRYLNGQEALYDAHGLKEVFGLNTNAEFQTFVDDHHYMIADDISAILIQLSQPPFLHEQDIHRRTGKPHHMMTFLFIFFCILNLILWILSLSHQFRTDQRIDQLQDQILPLMTISKGGPSNA